MPNINDLLHDAERALDEGDRRRAGTLLNQALHYDFTNDKTWRLLYRMLGKDAGQSFEQFKLSFAKEYFPSKVSLVEPNSVVERRNTFENHRQQLAAPYGRSEAGAIPLPSNRDTVPVHLTDVGTTGHTTMPNALGVDDMLLKAEQAFEQGNRREAAVLLNQALRQDFTNDKTWHLLYRVLGKEDEQSLEQFKRAFAQEYFPDKVDLLKPASFSWIGMILQLSGSFLCLYMGLSWLIGGASAQAGIFVILLGLALQFVGKSIAKNKK